MPKRERVRPINWAGKLSKDARAANDWYERQLQDAGLSPPPPLEFEYAACLPVDEEVKGEP